MQVSQMARRGGKTHQCIRALRELGVLLIVACAQERERIIREYKLTPEEQKLVLIAQPGVLRGVAPDSRVVIDNADWVLSQFLGGTVLGITTT